MYELTKEIKAERHAELGLQLKKLRQIAGLTQRQMADRVGFNNSSMIGSIESGSRPVPPADLEAYAECLSIETSELAKLIVQYRMPHLHFALFEHSKAKP